MDFLFYVFFGVVTTVVSGILFARFPTVDCIPTIYRQSPVKSPDIKLTHCAVVSNTLDVIRKESQFKLIHSTVGKQAKRMPDTTVETTFGVKKLQFLPKT